VRVPLQHFPSWDIKLTDSVLCNILQTVCERSATIHAWREDVQQSVNEVQQIGIVTTTGDGSQSTNTRWWNIEHRLTEGLISSSHWLSMPIRP
jgi:hypothetical protein